jgi:hypothetical protein
MLSTLGFVFVIAWALSGARSKGDRARVLVATLPFPALTFALPRLVPEGIALPASIVAAVAGLAVAVAMGHHVRKRAMDAVLAGPEGGEQIDV